MTRVSVLSTRASADRRSKPRTGPSFTETHYVLLPGLAELRKAEGPYDVISIFDESIPDHLQVKTVAEMMRRPQLYRPNIIADAIRLIGFAALAKETGKAGAAAAVERFCPIDGTA